MPYIVYKATAPNGKCYIGYTSHTLRQRMMKHYNNANQKVNRPILDAIRKFGRGIKWEILATYETQAYALNREAYFIKLYKSLITESGYNFTTGGEGRPGPINRNKHSRRVIDENGVIYESLAEAGRSVGGAKSDDVRLGILRKSLVRGMSFSFYENGMIRSEKYADKRYTPIFCHQTGKIYKSCAEAARELNLAYYGNVQKVAQGKRKQYRGFTFEFPKAGGGLSQS